jgi:hypothetical protein
MRAGTKPWREKRVRSESVSRVPRHEPPLRPRARRSDAGWPLPHRAHAPLCPLQRPPSAARRPQRSGAAGAASHKRARKPERCRARPHASALRLGRVALCAAGRAAGVARRGVPRARRSSCAGQAQGAERCRHGHAQRHGCQRKRAKQRAAAHAYAVPAIHPLPARAAPASERQPSRAPSEARCVATARRSAPQSRRAAHSRLRRRVVRRPQLDRAVVGPRRRVQSAVRHWRARRPARTRRRRAAAAAAAAAPSPRALRWLIPAISA